MVTAVEFCDRLVAWPRSVMLFPTERHWPLFAKLCGGSRIKGALVNDANLAALCIEHRCELGHDRQRLCSIRRAALATPPRCELRIWGARLQVSRPKAETEVDWSAPHAHEQTRRLIREVLRANRVMVDLIESGAV